jgi:GAF domain-containing protein
MSTSSKAQASDLQVKLHALHFAAQSLDSFLTQLTVLAADIVDADTSAGVTVIRDGQPTTVAASDERTKHFDELQYGNGDGPCLTAARVGDVVTVHDTASDDRWPDYHAQAFQEGLRSSLSVPLTLGDEAAGALNLYVFARHQFDDTERAVIGQFCDESSRAVSLAIRHHDLTRENDHLHAAMATRRVIDQALGLIIAQNRCSPDEAFNILRRASQNRNVKISQLAADMISTASGSKADPGTRWQS